MPDLRVIAVAALLLAGCAAPASNEEESRTMASVSGTVTYLQRIALPPTAVVKVKLADVSRADAPAIALGEQLIETNGRQVPFAFQIEYDPARIDSRLTYVVQARIEDGGKLLFISDRAYPVITRGAPSEVDLILTPVARRD
jgi:putative lipoprotein